MARTAYQISLSKLPKINFAPATRVGTNQNAWTKSTASYKDRVKARSRSFVATCKWREQLAGCKLLRDDDGMWHVCHANGFSVAMFPCVSTAVAWVGCVDTAERKVFHAAHPKARRYTGGQFRL